MESLWLWKSLENSDFFLLLCGHPEGVWPGSVNGRKYGEGNERGIKERKGREGESRF